MKRLLSFIILLVGMSSVQAQSIPPVGVTPSPIPVDLELSLVIDVSGSISSSDYVTQLDGYAEAFRSQGIQNAILSGTNGAIAVNTIFYGGGAATSAVEAIGFTLLDSVAQIETFADSLGSQVRPDLGNTSTSISNGLNLAVSTFNNGFEGTRQVIDVSGDGVNSSGPSVTSARDAAQNAGIDTINGLAIEGAFGTSITAYYRDNVIIGSNAFVVTADGFDDFSLAVQRKLRREILDLGEIVEGGGGAGSGLGSLIEPFVYNQASVTVVPAANGQPRTASAVLSQSVMVQPPGAAGAVPEPTSKVIWVLLLSGFIGLLRKNAAQPFSAV